MRLKELAKPTPSLVRCAFGTRKTMKTMLSIYPEAASKLTQKVVSPIRAPSHSNLKSEHEKLQSVKNRCVYCFELWSKPLPEVLRSRSYTRPRPLRLTQCSAQPFRKDAIAIHSWHTQNQENHNLCYARGISELSRSVVSSISCCLKAISAATAENEQV